MYQGYALKLSNGNYTGLSLANEIQEILNATIPDLAFTCSYGIATGKISIKAGVDKEFKVFSNFQVSSIDPSLSDPWKGWRDNNDYVITVDVSNLNSINEVLRNTSGIFDGTWAPGMDPLDTEFTSEFLDLLNVHNIYIHSSTLGLAPWPSYDKQRSILTTSVFSPISKHGKVPWWMPNPMQKLPLDEVISAAASILQDKTMP